MCLRAALREHFLSHHFENAQRSTPRVPPLLSGALAEPQSATLHRGGGRKQEGRWQIRCRKVASRRIVYRVCVALLSSDVNLKNRMCISYAQLGLINRI